jgi:cyclopropane fatty-acyl-phospholipid synthase-like methyltransferase
LIQDSHCPSSSAFFEAKYQGNADPWNFASNAYEQRRYDAIIRAIAHCRYDQAFEPGCSIGVLTERLAAHCDAVHAIDFSPSACAQAVARCAHLPQVEVHCAGFPEGTPAKQFDLLILSEIGYYFTAEEWKLITTGIIDSMPRGASVLAAHWLGQSQDHRMSGDEVHAILLANRNLRVELTQRNADLRLNRLVRL